MKIGTPLGINRAWVNVTYDICDLEVLLFILRNHKGFFEGKGSLLQLQHVPESYSKRLWTL